MNRKVRFLLIALVIVTLLSSCAKEESKLVSSQYNFSIVNSYNLKNSDDKVEDNKNSIFSNDLKDSQYISTNSSLSYGALFSSNEVDINQVKITNEFFNWTFKPVRIKDNDLTYYGAKNLVIPNIQMIGKTFDCSIYLNNGTLLKDRIVNPVIENNPIDMKLFLYNDLLVFMKKDADDIKVDISNYENLDNLENNNQLQNYYIRFYYQKKLLFEKELDFDINEDIYKNFKSSYLRKSDSICVLQKVGNNVINCDLYKIVK